MCARHLKYHGRIKRSRTSAQKFQQQFPRRTWQKSDTDLPINLPTTPSVLTNVSHDTLAHSGGRADISTCRPRTLALGSLGGIEANSLCTSMLTCVSLVRQHAAHTRGHIFVSSRFFHGFYTRI